MGKRISRREALRSILAGAAASALQPCALADNSSRTQRLGVCAISYALRWPSVNRGQGSIEETLEFIDYCHQLGAGGVQIFIRPETDFVSAIRAKIMSAGMYLEGQISLPHTDGELDRFEAQVRGAKEAGATVLRTACLAGRRYEMFHDPRAFAEFAQHAEESITRAEPIVRKHQMRLAVENHKDWRVPEFAGLLNRLSSEYVGACLDTGNNIALLEDPMAVVEVLAPYAFSTHLKDMAVKEYDQGFLLAEVALGQGFLDLPRIVSTLRRQKPELQFNLEMITRDPLKVPCLAPSYWASSETLPAVLLASTLSMVRAHAAKEDLPQISSLASERQIKAEDTAVRRSMTYAREQLDL